MKHKGRLYFVLCVAVVAFGVIRAQIVQRTTPLAIASVSTFSDLPSVIDDAQATMWIFTNIHYDNARALARVNDIQSYQLTLSRKAGICKDTAVLLLTIVEKEFHESGELVVLKMPGATEGYLHAVVRVNGRYLDPTYGKISNDPPGAIVAILQLDQISSWK